jgi:hypothetical protein
MSTTVNVRSSILERLEHKGDVAEQPHRLGALANLVADFAAPASRLALQARNDIPRLAHLLEALQEGFDSLRRNLNDEVYGCPPLMLLRRVYPSR